jgi:hypothetical protein
MCEAFVYVKQKPHVKFWEGPFCFCEKSGLYNLRIVYIRRKKIPVVPGSYRKKIRVGRSEINFFLNIFFMVLAVFCWAIFSRVPTSILTRDAYFPWTNLGNLVQ